MKVKKRLLQVVSVGLICGSLSIPASASATTLNGGWTEGEGSWNTEKVSIQGPQAHNGWTEAHPDKFGYERAVGETVWKGVYHYTRARMVDRVSGGIRADSGRVHGSGYTIAKSPYASAIHLAKTFWGTP
ncbi:hypothetical protein [Melghirimyces algeriensis]|uniref:Bacteriocin (Lactococcin_972) n=1 Tax=Melghirimyces algeriensis TaxID=910412 RepID=A0A521F161_9BACL|nr:hypothetical protein [Melghirimyces algeriensis]SMO89938.1 hypothetical protein SAMN06264849_11225 [Melghirimyces algeriensis]